MCVCSLIYPGCNARGPYYIVICGQPRSTIFFPRYLTNGTFSEGGGKLLNKMCVLILSTFVGNNCFSFLMCVAPIVSVSTCNNKSLLKAHTKHFTKEA